MINEEQKYGESEEEKQEHNPLDDLIKKRDYFKSFEASIVEDTPKYSRKEIIEWISDIHEALGQLTEVKQKALDHAFEKFNRTASQVDTASYHKIIQQKEIAQ